MGVYVADLTYFDYDVGDVRFLFKEFESLEDIQAYNDGLKKLWETYKLVRVEMETIGQTARNKPIKPKDLARYNFLSAKTDVVRNVFYDETFFDLEHFTSPIFKKGQEYEFLPVKFITSEDWVKELIATETLYTESMRSLVELYERRLASASK